MKKLYIICLSFLLFSALPISLADSGLTLFNDEGSNGWVKGSASWVLSTDTTDYKVGNSSVKIEIPAHQQYWYIYRTLDNALNYSYGFYGFWMYTNLTEYQTVRIAFAAPDDTHFFYNYFQVYNGWFYYVIPREAMTDYNGGNWTNVTQLIFSLGADLANDQTLKIDYVTLTNDYPSGLNPVVSGTPIIIFYTLIAWLIICLLLSVKYFKWFGLIGALIPGVLLTVDIINGGNLITGSFYDETAQTVVNQASSLGYLWVIPLLLIVLNFVIPFVKKG